MMKSISNLLAPIRRVVTANDASGQSYFLEDAPDCLSVAFELEAVDAPGCFSFTFIACLAVDFVVVCLLL